MAALGAEPEAEQEIRSRNRARQAAGRDPGERRSADRAGGHPAAGTAVPDPGGPLMFVRYAYPPNSLGYCGPADFTAFREYAVAGVVDGGLVQLAQAFAGAWPYLELIAHGCDISDPLDQRVVEAYWVGNELLDKVPLTDIGDSMQDRFRQPDGRQLPVPRRGRARGRGSAPQLRTCSACTRGWACWATTVRPGTR